MGLATAEQHCHFQPRAFIDERSTLLARMKAWSMVFKKWLLLIGVFCRTMLGIGMRQWR
jgi:hypothetical protein